MGLAHGGTEEVVEGQGGKHQFGGSSPYHRYIVAKSGEVARQHPGISGFDRAKIMGDMWRQLPDSEREKYDDGLEYDWQFGLIPDNGW